MVKFTLFVTWRSQIWAMKQHLWKAEVKLGHQLPPELIKCGMIHALGPSFYSVVDEWYLIYGIINCFFSILQVRLESIEAVNKILEEANKRIQPTGTGMALFFISRWMVISCLSYEDIKAIMVLQLFPTQLFW